DEVLSVGDEGFKDKSARRIKGILRNGVTGLLVSHSVQQVRDLCNKALWLDKGRQIAFGPSYVVCNAYSAFLFTPKDQRVFPQNEQELYDSHNRFRIAWRLGVHERAAKKNPPNEPEAVRIPRLMALVDAMSPEEKKKILDEIDQGR
ncbi:MAG: hypothetical protein J6R94_00135, partial [Agathobacter sp.]|nr:hypothetical protein [Agathobacter sp.]